MRRVWVAVLLMGVAAQTMAWQQRLGGLPAPMQPATKAVIGVPFLPELGADARVAVLMGFNADPTTDPSGWPMVDVSGDLQHATGIRITPGRTNEQTQSQPARAELTLLNLAGDYTTRRIQSRYWPGVRVGIPIAVIVNTGSSGELDRFTGFVDGLYQTRDVSGNYAAVRVTAKGVLSRLGQGTAPLRSPLYRAHTAAGTLVVYWALEDGNTATAGVNAVTGGPSMVASGTVTFGSVTDLAGSVQAPDVSQGTLRGLVTGGSASSWRVEFDLKAAYNVSMPSLVAAVRIVTSGGDGSHRIYFVQMPQNASDVLGVYILVSDTTATGALLDFSSWAVNAWHHYAITARQSGSNVVSELWIDGTLRDTQTLAGAIGPVAQVTVNPSVSPDVTSAGHVAVGNGTTLSAAGSAYNGYDGEGCWTRFLRLCAEEDIPAAISNGATSGGKAMGPQRVNTLINLLRECEAVDGGVMADG